MNEQPVRFYSKLRDLAFSDRELSDQELSGSARSDRVLANPARADSAQASGAGLPKEADRLAPSTCVEAEPFALRVLDDSMQPEFRRGCIIVIDPTGRATNGSYVLAHTDSGESGQRVDAADPEVSGYLFRQLQQTADSRWMLRPLNDAYPSQTTADDLHQIVGVIVQRAGTRRSYHKRYA